MKHLYYLLKTINQKLQFHAYQMHKLKLFTHLNFQEKNSFKVIKFPYVIKKVGLNKKNCLINSFLNHITVNIHSMYLYEQY